MNAIPPSGLTNLLRDAETSREMGEELRRKNCLSKSGVDDFSGLVRLIEETRRAQNENVARRPAGWVGGPDHVDAIAEALVNSPYLNEKALQLYNTDLRDV